MFAGVVGVVGVIIIGLTVTLFFCPIHVESSSPFYNISNEGNITVFSVTTTLHNSSNISAICDSDVKGGGVLNLIVQNFTIFLAIVGAFSLYCYFYYNITFNANYISEYPESEQKKPIIFLQMAILLIILLIIYAIEILFFGLQWNTFEVAIIAVFFILAGFSGSVFSEYTNEIRTNFNNMIEFAAIRDWQSSQRPNIIEVILYWIPILGFILPIIIVVFGIISDFHIFPIVLIITLLLLIIWQIHTINNGPCRIFDIILKDENKEIQGFILTKPNGELIRIFANDDRNEGTIIQIPRESIKYIVLNRQIKRNELSYEPKTFNETFIPILISKFWELVDLLKILCRLILGYFGGLIFISFASIIAPEYNNEYRIVSIIYTIAFIALVIHRVRSFRHSRLK